MLTRRSMMFKGAMIAAATTVVAFPVLGCDTSWITTAVNDIPVIVQVVDSLINIAGNFVPQVGAASPLIIQGVTIGATAAKASLIVLEQLIQDYGKTKNASVLAKIDITLTDIQGNLTQLLSAAHVNDVALQTMISTGISLALSTLAAIQLLIPPQPTASARRMAAPQMLKTKIVILTPEQIKSQYNSVAALNGYGNFQVN